MEGKTYFFTHLLRSFHIHSLDRSVSRVHSPTGCVQLGLRVYTPFLLDGCERRRCGSSRKMSRLRVDWLSRLLSRPTSIRVSKLVSSRRIRVARRRSLRACIRLFRLLPLKPSAYSTQSDRERTETHPSFRSRRLVLVFVSFALHFPQTLERFLRMPHFPIPHWWSGGRYGLYDTIDEIFERRSWT